MTTTLNQNSEALPQYKVIGTRPIRHDGLEKVTGAAKYGADTQLSGMLHGKILRSAHAHARIRSIDTSKAEALPGVFAVATSKDFPIIEDQIMDLAETQGNIRLMAEHVMAHDKVLYKGHALAAVAAANPHIAEQAVGLIEVDYEVLPTVLTLHDALKPDAPLLHENLTTMFKVERFGRGDDTGVQSNVAGHIQHKLGDIEKGFAEADIIVEREFETQTVHQGYIEPHAATAVWATDGRVTIWTCTQGAFAIRSSSAAMLGIPESAVKVVPTEIGGGFGAKITTYLEPVVAVLARKTGRPVKIVMDRKEVFEGTGPTSGTHIRCKIGANKNGKITAAQLYMAYEAGAYPGSPVGGGTLCATGPYNIENLLVDGYDIVCNKQKVQAYRAPGQPQGCFAVESVIDELAEKLGMDSMEFRLKNAVKEGDRMPTGVPHAVFGCREMEEAMMAHPHYSAPLEGPNTGRGMAVGFRWQGGQSSSATINVNNNGTINLITGSVDIGGTRTAVAMQAAEVLGLRAEDVWPTVVDTDAIGYTATTGGSRTAFDTGLAAIAASEEVKRQMAARAALIWEVQPEDVEFQDGTFICTRNPDDRLTFKELSGRLMRTGGPITCSVGVNSTGVGPIIAGNIIDVRVDPETGKVDVLRCTAFIDSGKAVHPSYVEGQMQGGTVQGIGWALNEEYFYNPDGTMMNSSFLDYRMPTILDVPMIDTVITEVPNPRHPFGLRGVGEAPIIPPLAAMSNAIYHAVGVRLTKLPMSPGAILDALDEKKNQG
ncbi:MAG: xanthine dehydrogenase family protein molybdopterin-binding subunit [Chloroflexi bacterium]|nr:xanthine dehydrogenase family protein molybdopterin-binding subunit [Chloroflexota bacterium]MCH8350706.1 xanthine dehydrogenase family protein molybdopterin-binding subunit [Chloroflexota bacterium]